MTIMVCPTRCWECQHGDCPEPAPAWHSWADDEDIAHAKATGQQDPSLRKCGCWCVAQLPVERPVGRTSRDCLTTQRHR